MRYENYKVEDFLFDEFFVRWVRKPGPETEHFWKSWLIKNPDKLNTINEAREIILSTSYKNKYQPSEKDYNEVLENILKHPTSWTQSEDLKKSNRLVVMMKYAAVLVIIFGLGALFVFKSIDDAVEVPVQSLQMIEKQNPNGQKTTFVLDDGTIVKLNAGSKLTFNKTFDANERRVSLQGEAFFEVKRDESRPFIVETANLTTTVLGTSFNVKSYPDEEITLVAVLEGKVQVNRSESYKDSVSEQIILDKNQMAVFNSGQDAQIKKRETSGDVFCWKDNIICFKHSNFSTIKNTLSRWYGVEFDIAINKSFEGRFTAKYDNQPLNLVLEGLKGEYNFDYEIEGRTIYIY